MQNENWNRVYDRYAEASVNIDIKRIVRVLASRWYWVLGSLALALAGCFVFLQISNSRYVSSVLLSYSEKQTELNELNQLLETDAAASQKYLTERYVIISEEVVNGAVKKLNYPFTFYSESTFRTEDIYPYQPFTAQIVSYEASEYGFGVFQIQKDGIITYKTEKPEDEVNEELKFDLSKDTLISVKGLSFKVNSVARLTQDYIFSYNDPNQTRRMLSSLIYVNEAERNMSILNVSFSHSNRRFTQDFLQKLIESYQEYNLQQKKLSSNLTINFIREQTQIYADALRKASSELEVYKQRQSVPNLQASMSDVMGQMTQFETQKNTLEIQKAYIDLLEQSLNNRFEPVNIGSIGLDNTTDGVLVGLVQNLNKLILDRKNFIVGKNLSVNNPVVKAADDEIERIREQILSNIRVQKEKNESTLRIITQNLTLLKKRIDALPSVERELGYLQNDRDVNEKIYLLLINKEIEASIIKAGMLPSFTVLTRTNAYKVAPRAVVILSFSVLLGLIVGLGSIFLVRYLNNKFVDISEIGKNGNTTLLGVIQRYPDEIRNNEKDLHYFLDNRSLFSESVNGIRTNLSFLTEIKENRGKLLMVTSEVAGEGKSFVTINLAISLTKVDKKVLIVVSDLRRSRLHRFFNNNNKIGLSNYLAGKIDNYEKVVQHSAIDKLDYIPAGPVPFNPAELIQQSRFDAMLDACLQQYDFVIVDTAPIGLVSDNIPLLRKSDLVLFVIRWLYSSKEAPLLAQQMTQELEIKQVGIIINDFYKDNLYASISTPSYASKGYGYKYSYDYYGKSNNYYSDSGTKKRSLWRKIKGWFRPKS